MAAVALANGLNANMLRKWVAEAQANPPDAVPVDRKPIACPAPAFVPLAQAAPQPPQDGGAIRIEVRRGATAVTICWPSASGEVCAAWLRDLLR